MAELELAAISTENIRIPVRANVDPTSDPVEMAFMDSGAPDEPDWTGGSWASGGPPYVALCLVGPDGGVELAVGTYTVWLRITDNPERPAGPVGTLRIVEVPGDSAAMFASISELGEYLGQDLEESDPRALAILKAASAAVQAWTGQTISKVTDDTVVLTGSWSGVLALPQLPVVGVASASVNTGGSIYEVPDFQLRPDGHLLFGAALEALWGPDPDDAEGGRAWGGPNSGVTVTYTHGFDPIPEDVKAATLFIACRIWDRPDAPAQATGYAAAGATVAADGLTTLEQRLLRKYRIQMMSVAT